MVMGGGALNRWFDDWCEFFNSESCPGCTSNPKVVLWGSLGEFQVVVGNDDESLRGSNLFIPETERRREFIESDLFALLALLLDGFLVENIVGFMDGRDLCRGIVRALSLCREVEI
jgi:hypothetical protein